MTPSAPELARLGAPTDRLLAGYAELDGATVQRIHGDLHVGQLLRGPHGVVAIDFEGDPTQAPEERRRQASPLRDVASLLLSLDHVAAAAAACAFCDCGAGCTRLAAAARAEVGDAYDATVTDAGTMRPALLRAFEVEKEWREALYAARSCGVALCSATRAPQAADVNPELFLADVLRPPSAYPGRSMRTARVTAH